MAITFKKARRSVARIKIAIGGVSGSGKTMSSLLMAFGLIKAEHPQWSDAECWEHVCIIDTENASGALYVGAQVGSFSIGEYNTVEIEPPFKAQKYIDAVHLAEQNDQSVIIIDSMSHMWNSTGGALEKQQQIAARSGNSYTAWAPVKKEIKAAMDTILQSPAHIIADFRAKQEYVQEKNEKGKTIVRNVGLGFQFQDGMEFEFTSLFYLDSEHVANATKDRTGMFTGKFFTITPDTGRKFYEWLSSGVPAQEPAPTIQSAAEVKAEAPHQTEAYVPDMAELDALIKAAVESGDRAEVTARIKEICGTANYRKVEDTEVLANLYKEFKEN